MHISWDDAQIFLAVAEAGSFSEAARLLRQSQPTVSRRIAELEYRLGLSLFHRGRRGADLTDDGARLLPSAQQMARWATEFEHAVAAREQQVRGRVRLAAAPGVAYDFLVPFSANLRTRHPDLQLEILASVDYVDLTRGDADLALRSRPPQDPALVQLAELAVPVSVFATPAYAATLPARPTPADVGWICWAHPYRHMTPNPELEALIPDFAPAFASDSYLIQHRACLLGLGAMFLPKITHPLFPDPGLVELSLDLPPITGAVYLVCARSAEHIPRIRAVATALARELGRVQTL